MKLFGIIGKPLDQSLSPELFNRVFKKRGLSCRYLPFQVEKADLKNLILCMKLTDVHGLNVTAPYKGAVLPFLDRLDSRARKCGAVNTIVRRKNRFWGTNTDGAGFVNALRQKGGMAARGKCVAILGAGGAARGVAGALAGAGAAKICFFNRNGRRAARLARFFKKRFPKTKWESSAASPKAMKRFFPETDLLIQATPLSRRLPLGPLPSHALVSDMVYHPRLTPLLKQARRRRLKTLDGGRLLLSQASLNLKLWTGLNLPPDSLMRLGIF